MAREIWKKQREKDIADSNNKNNPNQNVCAYHVARVFGCAEKVIYLHRMSDLIRALRKRWQVRSRKSMVKKLLAKKKAPMTVAQVRKIIPKITDLEDKTKTHYEEFYDPNHHRNWVQEQIVCNDIRGFVLLVEGHVLALDRWGDVWVDTDPRHRDRRKVTMVYMVNRPIALNPYSVGWSDEIDPETFEKMMKNNGEKIPTA